jgi:HD superfamily phosphohydrolase
MSVLNELGEKKRFRDPLYGYVWLTKAEVEIVDTAIFQRLRRIQQLALTKYVYPTAEHSRFVHSIGVVQCATNIFLELLRKNREFLLDLIGEELIRFIKTLRFAALLHDIGHLPFSHATERVLLPAGLKHEHVSQYIVKRHPEIKNILENENANPDLIASLLGDLHSPRYSVIKKIISGVFDADRADYLLRDSYNCGVTYGNYDYIRYVSSFNLVPHEGKSFALTIDEGSIHTLEAFLLARFHYNLQIPYHRTRTALDCSLERYIEFLKRENRLPTIVSKFSGRSIEEIDLDHFTFFDDFEIFQEIKKDNRNRVKWTDILLREDHLYPLFDRSDLEAEDKINYSDLIVRLEEDGLEKHNDFLTYSKQVKIHDLVSGTNENEKKDSIQVTNRSGEIIGNCFDCSPVLKYLQRNAVQLLRIYVVKDRLAKANEVLYKFNDHLKKRKGVQREG